MIRRLNFAAPAIAPLIAAAALALVPTDAPAQGGGLGALDATVNEDGAEAWAICTLASSQMYDLATSDRERTLRDREREMLVAVSIQRFVEQRGLTFDQAIEAVTAIVTARAPRYEDGSGTERADMGKCILSGMVSQTGEQQAERLVAAFQALPQAVRAAFAGDAPPPAAAPAAAPPATVARAAEIGAEMDFSASLGPGENFGAVSYRINSDGTLSGFYGYKAPGVVFTETAVPRVPGQGLAGTYDASGAGANGSYASSFEIVEKHRLDGGVVTVYRIVLTVGGDTIAGTGVYAGGTTLSAVFGADMIGRFHMGEDLAGWDLFLVRDAGNTAVLSQFRFEGAHFEGSHDVLADGVRLGTANFTRDAAGVVRIAMPDGSSVVAVCAPEGNITC